jgi:hypothetical protein
MVQGSQTQWVPILQYSGHRSKLTNRWSILILTQLNNLSSHVRNTKTHLPPLIPGLIHPTPSSSCLTKKFSDTRDWTTDARALRERERASEQARKHRSLRSYVREGSAAMPRGSGPGRGVARHVTSGGRPYPLSLGPLASTEWSLNQRGFFFFFWGCYPELA